MCNNLAIIPARGGSKRIPRKNIKDFLSKPIIAYSIEMALKSGLFDEVMVSTDDEEIMNVSKKYGAKVPFMRSKATSDDFATTMDVIVEVIKAYDLEFNKKFENVCCIYPAAPLIQCQHLKSGLLKLTKGQLASVFPVVAFSYPVWRGLEITEEGKTQMLWPEHLNARSQDLKQIYHDAGQWYWFKPEEITGSFFTTNSAVVILSEEEVQDIDTLTDWSLAEMKYKILHEGKGLHKSGRK